MIKGSQITKGMVLVYENEPHKVMDLRNTMSGRGGNTVSTKLRNILTGVWAEHRFKSDDKVEKAFIEKKEFDYLYVDGNEYCFMDTETYDQIMINKEEIEDVIGYLLPNTKCLVQLYSGKAIGVEPPKMVELVVAETEPGLKGATASSSVTKPATLETGITIQVPMFINNEEVVIVNTLTGEYAGRPSKK